jgi:FtsP/CotA-like multicopper oxidase with cupredoxin domain
MNNDNNTPQEQNGPKGQIAHKIVFLKGERINLRLINAGDAETFATWINDQEISQ